MLIIFILQCHWQNTSLGDCLFRLVEIKKCWSDSDSEFPVQEKILYEVGQSALQPHAMHVFHYSKLPGGLISLLQIKEDFYKSEMPLTIRLARGCKCWHLLAPGRRYGARRSPLSEYVFSIYLSNLQQIVCPFQE